MSYFLFVNSIVGKRGGVGVRADYILKRAKLTGQRVYCLSRGRVAPSVSDVTYFSMGLLGHVSRLLNAVRIYVYPKFNHRKYDVFLFEWFVKWRLPKCEPNEKKVAHIWESSPEIISFLRLKGFFVILDLPMAPSSYNKRLRESGENDFLYYNEHLVRKEKEAFELADIIISPSDFVLRELIEIGVARSKIRLVEFGVDPLSSLPDAKDDKQKVGLDFCFFGNISKRKGVPELLNVWSNREFAVDRLHLCGRIYPEVQSQINLSKSGELITPGFVDAVEYMKKCDVFILPSWLEGSSKAVYESMSAGLVSIVTKSSGSIVRDGIDGFVIEAGDTESLLDKMLWIKRHPFKAKKMGVLAQEHVSSFTWEVYADKVIQVYKEGE